MECWRRAVVDSSLDWGTGAPGRARRRRGYSGEVWVGVGMPSSEEEGATSGQGGPGKRNWRRRGARVVSGAARGSSLWGAASRLLRRGGRASGCPPVRKAVLGVAGVANRWRRSSGDALKTKTIDEEEERREAAVYTRGTFSPGSIHRPGLKHL